MWIRPPSIVGPHVRACAIEDVPRESPARGPEKRRREFAAGRECAARALSEAGAFDVFVGVASDRAPIWPAGFVGSITHTSSLIWAAVARSDDLRSLGVDSEPVFDDAARSDVLSLALDANERTLLKCESERELATVAFSAKESLYKCLYPCCGVYFDFPDAQVEWVESRGHADGTFGLRLRRSLCGDFPSGMRLSGRYAIERGHVHTAVELTK